MIDSNHFNRDAAFTFDIKNPDVAGSSDSIQWMVELGGSLFCFSEQSISTILTADTIDPAASEPSTRHGYQILYSVGSRNPLVARSILQARKILHSVVLKDGPEIKKAADFAAICRAAS